MPAESIRELIIQDIESTLLTVVAGALYHHTILKVVRFEAWTPNLNVYPACAITLLDSDESDSESSTRQTVTMRFLIMAELEQHANLERDTSRLIDDIKRVLVVDITRNSLALDTQVTSARPFLTDGAVPRGGATIEGNVRFRHLFGDPYTLA